FWDDFDRDGRRAGGLALPHSNADARALFAANSLRAEAIAAGRVEKRLRLPPGRTSGEQYRAALERFGPGAKGSRLCRGGIESARPRSAAREDHGAALGPG